MTLEKHNEFTRETVNLETSQIAWRELQRFFANGTTVFVDQNLDLVEVALTFIKDQNTLVENWVNESQIHKVTDQQALEWYENDMLVWAVVVKPWILVQAVPT